MRYLRTGVNAGGRSCVLSEEVPRDTLDAMAQHVLYQSDVTPPPPRPGGNAEALDLGVAPGLARWIIVEWPPGTETPYHHTDTVDFDTVIEGSIVLILDDGEHLLEAGDCVLIPGVDHGWRVGPQRCTTSVALLGSARMT
jgi:quercetin dioxygenase-like cupin family protein